MSGLNIAAVLSLLVALAAGVGDSVFQGYLTTLFGKYTPQVLAGIAVAGFIAREILSQTDKAQTKAVVASNSAVVADIVSVTDPAVPPPPVAPPQLTVVPPKGA
jgi:hypothetical protein